MEDLIGAWFKVILAFLACAAAFFGALYCADFMTPNFNGFADNFSLNAFRLSVWVLLYIGAGFIVLIFIGCSLYIFDN